ncbi:MAG: hypothetical protein IT514_04465 [Burkholderiales bacterium]|nr:hypothetical protein [Burkholderiales bacterium]
MEKPTATSILQALAHGIDPRTGEAWPADSPYQHPDTIRALFCALQALRGEAPPPRPARTPPGNAGKPWSEEEDRRLAAGFDAGIRIPELAGQHGRSRTAIEARLLKLGKLAVPSGRAPRFRVASPQAVYAAAA